ncbi:MAG: peptidylprolyl isomerase [Muribaculaceae bacterium]|nr:FKBP-type peptidyl-prolyl cis-trans isomerase [Bacteroidales bacterium]
MTNEQNQKITPGKYAEITYNLYTEEADGSAKLVHQVDADNPERLVFGVTQGMIEPLEKALDGLTVGDSFSVKVTSDESFGPRDPEKIVTLDKEIFLIDGKFDKDRIFVGAAVPMMTAEGFRITGIVNKITDDKVTMDFNHPLAGCNLRFDGTVVTVRDATEEELHPVQGCGGCQGGSCDGCGSGDCGCGDGCGCK